MAYSSLALTFGQKKLTLAEKDFQVELAYFDHIEAQKMDQIAARHSLKKIEFGLEEYPSLPAISFDGFDYTFAMSLF